MTKARFALRAAAIAIALGMPSLGWATNPPRVDPDHFQCYTPIGDVRFEPRAVTLEDQFGKAEVKVVRVVFLCNPVDKNGEGIKDKRTHLICYTEEGGNSVKHKVRTQNQFGKLEFAVGQARLLCVPSLKKVLQ